MAVKDVYQNRTRRLNNNSITDSRYVLYWNADDRRAANDLAVALWKQHKAREAGEVLEDLLLQEPGNVDARYNLEEIRKELVESRDGMTTTEKVKV